MLGQAVVGFIAAGAITQLGQALVVVLVSAQQFLLAEVPGQELIADLQGVLKQSDHLAWKILGSAGRVFSHRVGAPQHMADALLVPGLGKARVIGRVAIVRHAARPADADDCLQHFAAAAWVDGEGRGPIVSDPTVEPDEPASQPPAGFIGREMPGLAEVLLDFLIGGLETSAGPQHDLGTGAARQVEAIGVTEMIDDLAVGQAGLFVERNNGGLSVGADLTGRGTDRSAGLHRMPAMHTPTASAAGSLVKQDEATPRLDGNVFLVLRIDLVLLGDVAAAKRTVFGQRSFERLIDLIRRRRQTLAMLAISGSLRPGSRPGILLWLALGERRCLPLARALGFVELRLEPLAFSLETGIALLQFADATLSLSAARAKERGHTVTLAECPARSCASFLTSC